MGLAHLDTRRWRLAGELKINLTHNEGISIAFVIHSLDGSLSRSLSSRLIATTNLRVRGAHLTSQIFKQVLGKWDDSERGSAFSIEAPRHERVIAAHNKPRILVSTAGSAVVP